MNAIVQEEENDMVELIAVKSDFPKTFLKFCDRMSGETVQNFYDEERNRLDRWSEFSLMWLEESFGKKLGGEKLKSSAHIRFATEKSDAGVGIGRACEGG